MVKFKCLYCIILLVFVELAVSLIPNVTNIQNINNDLRRSGKKKKKDRSTSSSGEGRGKDVDSAEDDKESLELSDQDTTSKESDKSKKPLSSLERRGWRKWHRKCRVCKEDMLLKYRDPTIKWICGGYQRARRSFKSECMMHYRNCQDGTSRPAAVAYKLLIPKNLVFVKIKDHRCTAETGKGQPQGIDFFYEYKVLMSGDSSESQSKTEDSSDGSSEFKFK